MDVAPEPPVPLDMRSRILDAAERLGDELGAEGITMRHLAAGAGITTAALYQHFDGKAALLDALIARVHAHHRAVLTEACASAEAPAMRFHRICLAHVDFALTVSWRYAIAFQRSDVDVARPSAGSRSFVERLTSCLADAGHSVPDATAFLVWIAVHGLASALTRSDAADRPGDASADAHELVDAYVRMLFRGIGGYDDAASGLLAPPRAEDPAFSPAATT